MSKIDIEELLKILPQLIRENDTVKGAIISALSGVVATHEDIVELNKAIDKRFKAMEKRMDKRFEAMDKRFEAMDKRFETLVQEMNKRFESTDDKIDTKYNKIISLLENIQNQIGKPFEQFARNVVTRLLNGEGIKNVKLKSVKIEDPSETLGKDYKEIEIDGFSLDPPIIVEITSVLRDKSKVDQFLAKKKFVEEKYSKNFRGFFVAASTKFDTEELASLSVELRQGGSELINL